MFFKKNKTLYKTTPFTLLEDCMCKILIIISKLTFIIYIPWKSEKVKSYTVWVSLRFLLKFFKVTYTNIYTDQTDQQYTVISQKST